MLIRGYRPRRPSESSAPQCAGTTRPYPTGRRAGAQAAVTLPRRHNGRNAKPFLGPRPTNGPPVSSVLLAADPCRRAMALVIAVTVEAETGVVTFAGKLVRVGVLSLRRICFSPRVVAQAPRPCCGADQPPAHRARALRTSCPALRRAHGICFPSAAQNSERSLSQPARAQPRPTRRLPRWRPVAALDRELASASSMPRISIPHRRFEFYSRPAPGPWSAQHVAGVWTAPQVLRLRQPQPEASVRGCRVKRSRFTEAAPSKIPAPACDSRAQFPCLVGTRSWAALARASRDAASGHARPLRRGCSDPF